MNTCDRCKGETTLLHKINPHWLPEGAPVTMFCQHCTDIVDHAISNERNRTGNGSRKFKICQKRIEKKLGAKDWSAFGQNLRQQAWQVAPQKTPQSSTSSNKTDTMSRDEKIELTLKVILAFACGYFIRTWIKMIDTLSCP